MRGLLAGLALAALAGCENELPTLTGEERFPGGTLPTTVEIVLPAEGFVLEDTLYADFTDARGLNFLLVAERFDGVLTGHSLARLTGFPDSITFSTGGATRTDTTFTYGAGRVITVVDSLSSASPGPARLRLWALDQAWDSATVTWERASAGTPWRVPGGTPGALLAEATWTPADTAARADSVVWQVDSLTVARMAREDFRGLLVTSETPGTRLQLSRLFLETRVRPGSRPDTAITRVVGAGPQAFIYTPAPPRPDSVYRVGGPTGDRTVLRLNLAQQVPVCASPQTTPCARVPLRDVTLNQAQLLLQPLSVPGGFRPTARTNLGIRRVVEPELGRRAPLAEPFALDSIPAAVFGATPGAPLAIDLTTALRDAAADTAVAARQVSLALLADPEGQQFGYLWFAARPRLRLVYTLPQRPQLP